MSDTTFSRLLAGAGPLWSAAQDHPFVHALDAGTLEESRFLHYLKQDYVFLQSYSRALAMAAARTTSPAETARWIELARATHVEELQLHREYCASLGIMEEELEAVLPSPICHAYSNFMLATAAQYGPLELLAAIAPCAVGYAEIGLRLQTASASLPQPHPYALWIESYACPQFGEFADWVREALNSGAAGHSALRFAELQQLFNLGCQYEWLFWEMAWTLDGWPLRA